MKKRYNLAITVMTFLFVLCYGCATIKSQSGFSGDIRGIITNIAEIKQYLSKDSYLQVIEYPKDGVFRTFETTATNYDNTKYVNGKLISGSITQTSTIIYPSALKLEKSAIPQNGDFTLHVNALRPGRYFIAAQPITGFPPARFCDSQQRIMIIEVLPNTQFPLNLGKGLLSLKPEAGR